MISKNLSKLIKYLKLYKKDFVIVLLSLICVAASLLAFGQAFRKLVDQGLSSNQIAIINKYIIISCFLIAIFGISSFLRSYNINNITAKIINKIRLDAYSNLIDQKIKYFEEQKVSSIITKLTLDLELISKLITNFLSFFIRNSIMLIGAILFMFLQSYKLSLIVIISIPIILFPLLKLSKYVRALSQTALSTQDLIVSNIEESFTYIRTLHAFNQQQYCVKKFNDLLREYLDQTSIRLKIRSLFFALAMSFILASIIFVIWIGSRDIVAGEISPGKMISFIYYAVLASFSAGGIAELFSEIQSPLAAIDRVFALLNTSQDSNTSHLQQPDQYELNVNINAKSIIEFQDVSFSYPTRSYLSAIKNISFKLYNNSFVGIIGPSGSGKTTIMQLLLKFYESGTGRIFIHDQDINTLDADSIRNIIAYVPQEPCIFAGTIKSNILFSKPHATTDEIIEVAEITGVLDFASQLSFGLDTEIGERGIKLSGGQKQRISIARALLKSPDVLLLDEATSNIDSDSEMLILSRIKELMQNKLIISIAHRLSSLRCADTIIVVEKGSITYIDIPSEELKNSTFYKDLTQ